MKQTDSLRMEVSSPKLAVAIRGNGQITEAESYRYNILLKLLFTMMFGWTSDRFQRLYESGEVRCVIVTLRLKSTVAFIL